MCVWFNLYIIRSDTEHKSIHSLPAYIDVARKKVLQTINIDLLLNRNYRKEMWKCVSEWVLVWYWYVSCELFHKSAVLLAPKAQYGNTITSDNKQTTKQVVEGEKKKNSSRKREHRNQVKEICLYEKWWEKKRPAKQRNKRKWQYKSLALLPHIFSSSLRLT